MLGTRLAALAVALAATGCPASGPSPPPSCEVGKVDPATCAPLYPPTFENVYRTTITRSCGGNRSACHTATGDGNMDLSNITVAYESLLAGRVTPGDAACSELVVRVTGVGADYQMPQGSPLSASEQCAIAQWVDHGAVGVAP